MSEERALTQFSACVGSVYIPKNRACLCAAKNSEHCAEFDRPAQHLEESYNEWNAKRLTQLLFNIEPKPEHAEYIEHAVQLHFFGTHGCQQLSCAAEIWLPPILRKPVRVQPVRQLNLAYRAAELIIKQKANRFTFVKSRAN